MTDWWTDSPRAVDSEDSGAWWEVAPIVGGDEQEPDAPIDDSEQPPLIGPVSELLPFDAPAGRPRALLSDLPLDEDPVGGIGAALQPEPEEESSQPVSDLGKRAARGFVEVGAALPEALAIAGAGNPNASALFASEEITRSEEQIALAEKRLLDVPETDQETRLRIQDVISAEQRKIESYTPLRDIAEGPLKPDAQDRPLYKSGDAIRQVSEELFGTPDPRFDDRFMSKLAEGGGNMVGFVGVTLATGLIGGGVAGSSLNTSSMYKRAIQDGATEDQAKTAAYIGSVIGASEVLPIGSALKMLPTPVRNKVQGALARRMTNAFMSAGEEGLQEAMAETANNLTVKGVYNPDQKIFQGVTEAALIGGILGGGMGALAPTGGDGGTASTPTTQALIDKHATQEDHDSPTDTGLISEGKEQIEQMLNPSAQTIAPETPTNLPDGASPMALLSPEAENSPQRGTPEAPQASDEGLAPQRPEQPQRPAIGDSIAPMQPVPTEDEILPLFEDGVDTGKRARINPKTGAMEIVQEPDQAPAKPLAPANVDAQTTDPVQPAISPAVQELVDGGAEIILNGQKVPRSPAAGGLQAASSPDQATTIPQQPVQETDAQIQEAPEAQSLLETQDLGPDLAQRATPRAVEILSNEDLTNIETDAETFQYKSDGDSEGVTDRLRGVKKWDTTRAGSAIVFERADGSRVIADGHQRLGLAKRMRAEGQDVEMPVIIWREVDGWTAKDVMVQAALKNIGEVPIKGTPDPQQVVDAAKIMRAVPEMTAEIMDLPKASALARDAQRVRDLSDDAFGMLVNERASVRNAAAVGKTVKDKSAHANILQLLEKLKPENIFQSEQIARQAAAETTVETQDSLFGEEEITESLFLERARVMDVAIKRLRKDKATFNTLLQRGETIVGAGNVLDQDANKTRMNEDATVQEYLTRQANTKGPISDALSTAAKTVKEGGNIGQTVTGFIGHVRAGLAEDSQASQARPVSGRAVEPGPEGQAASASDSGQSGLFPSDEGRSPQKSTNDRGVLESGPEEQVTAPTAKTETTPPTFEEFRTQLPKDSDGYADVIGAGQKAIDQASGKSGVKWADLSDDGKKSAFQSVGGELQVSDDAAARPTVPPAAPAVPVPESAAPKEPNVSTNGPTGVEYPNRKLGFKYARSQDGGLEGGALGNIALSNMQVGEIIPGHGEITSITEKQIRVTGEGGKKKIISVEGNKFDQLSRDMTGLIEGSQHGVDAGDVLTALKRDPAFSYDENQIPQLSDTARGGKEGPNTAGILKPLAPVLDVNPHDQWYDGLTDDEQVTLHQKMGVSGLDWDKQSTDKKQAIHGEFKSVNLDPFPDAPTQTEQTPEGEQALIEGVKPITQKERLEAQMNKAKDGGNAAPPSGRGDLFGDPMDRADLFDANKTEQLPVGDQVQGVFNAALRAFRGAMDAYTKDNKQDVTPGNVLFTKMVEKADSSPEYRVKLRDWMAGKGSTIELRNIAEDFGSYWTDQGFSKAVDSLDSIQASLASQPKIGEGIKNSKVKSLPENNNLQDKGARKSKLDQERLGEVSSLGNTNKNNELGDLPIAPEGNGLNDEMGATETNPKPLEDFGEVLEGAQKHKAAEWADRVSDVSDAEVSTVPLSKSWPEPNYQELLTSSVPADVVAFIHAARDEIPTKPRGRNSKFKTERWVKQVTILRQLAVDLASGKYKMDYVREKAEQSSSLDGFIGRADLYEKYGHEKSLKKITMVQSQYSMREGVKFDPPKKLWVVSEGTHGWPKEFSVAETRQEAIDGFAPAHEAMGKTSAKRGTGVKFEIRQWRKDKRLFIGKKVGKKFIEVETNPDWDVKAARAYRAENQEALEVKFAKLKIIPPERGGENADRTGVDHRNGQDVTAGMFADAFGFRGVQFGNYVEGPKRQADMNRAYDGLMDLAGIINIPTKAISLNGSLGLAFGARGSGRKAAAHFETGSIVINLTKTQGAGSLAHEWWHAADNYFSRQGGVKTGFITEKAREGYPFAGVRPEVKDAFAETSKLIRSGTLKLRSQQADKRKSKPYFTQMREMSARSFESYVIAKLQDQGASNDYLANILSEEAWNAIEKMNGQTADSWPYVRATEMADFREAFDKLFDVIDTKETDTGTAMFSVPGKLDTFAAEFTTELAANDEVFRFPKAKSGNLKGAMAEINPETKYIGEMSDPDLRKEKGIDARHLLRTNKDTDFYVYENEDEAWIDVSRLGEGEGGNAVYAAVADYAFNTGREFIGDPDGLSDIALRRRTDAMLSSAFKHGTTKHLKPHQRQLDGDTALGVPAMKWVADDHVANMEEMIRVSVENIAHFVPEIKRARYDFKTGTFRTHQGKPLNDETLREWSNSHPRIRAAGAGRRTIKRVILFNTLSHAPSGERSGLLEQVLRRDDKLVTEGDLQGIFYSKPDANSDTDTTADKIGEADTRPQSSTSPDIDPRYSATTQGGDVTGELTPRFIEKAEKVARDLRLRAKKYGLGKMDVEVLGRLFGRMQDGSMSPVDGVFVDNVIFVALNSSEGVTTTFDHETIHALRSPQMWGRDHGLFKPAEWRALEARAQLEKDMIADLQDTYREDQITEEVVARLYSQWADGDLQAKGFLRTAFERIQRIIEALGNALRGNGFVTADSVFQKVSKGEIGARQGDVLQEVSEPRFSVPKKKQSTFTDGMDSPHIPDRKINDALRNSNLSMKEKVQGVKGGASDTFDKFRVQMQDRMLPLFRMEQAVGAARGREVTKDESAYFAEERFFSKVGRGLDKIDQTFSGPVVDMIAKQNYLKKSIVLKDQKGIEQTGMDAVSLFLYARHAKERNARIASINEKMPDGGSGMTNAEADAILSEAHNGKHIGLLNRIGDMSDNLVKDMIDLRENAGLLSAKEAYLWRTMYDHYVPLKGFTETDLAEASLDVSGNGRRFNVKGKESKSAMGRDTIAFDTLTNLITQAQEITIRAEKNAVGQAMLKFAQENPAPDMYVISEAKPTRYINRATGMVESRIIQPHDRKQLDSEMSVKVNGGEYLIEFKDQRLANALGNVGADQMGIIIQGMSKFSRYFSSINTMLSPPFIIKNAIRDMTAAQINLGAFAGKDAGAIRKAILKNWGRSFLGGYRAMQGKMDSKHAKLYREFEEAGGKVSFWHMEQPEAGQSDMQSRIKLDSSRAGKLRKGVKANTRDNPFLKWINDVNLAVDNSVRLSSYVEARNRGWTKAEAASLAKNLTVNFNRRGEMGAGMNALYPFANAAIQGTEVLLRAMKSNEVKGLAGGLFIAGFMQDVMNAALTDDDDDKENAYDKIPTYVQERNIILMPGTEYALTIPLPYGFNIFFYAGTQASKVMRGVKKPAEATAHSLMAVVAASTPLSGLTLQQAIMPTLADFGNELAQNEDWTGRNIRPEPAYADYGPKAYRHYRNVNPISREIAYGLNRATGGSSVRSGAIDFSPEYIDHTVNFLTGGMGRFISKSAGMATNIATGQADEIQASGVPFLRNYVYNPGEWLDRNRYWEFADKIKDANYNSKVSKETGDPLSTEQKLQAGLYEDFKTTEKKREKYKVKKNAVHGNAKLSIRQRNVKLKKVYKDENELFLDFNEKYVKALGRQGE